MSWKGYVQEVRVGDYFAGKADANGNAAGAIGPCPEGWCWYVERRTCYSNTSQGTPLLELYVLRSGGIAPADTITKAGRQDVFAATAAGPDNPKNGVHATGAPIFVGPGYFLVCVWSGLAQNDLVALSAQIRVHRLEAVRERPSHPGLAGEHAEKIAHAVVVGDEVAAV